MRRRSPGALLAAAALAWPSPARAVSPPTVYDNYQMVPIGSRAAGMGGAYTALACDEGALHYNPASLSCSDSSHLELSANAYVPIAGGTRCSIGIFSYLNTMTFGINADFDAFPDVDVLSGGIRAGIDELLALAGEKAGDDAAAEEPTGPERAAPAAGTTTRKTTARKAPAKKTAAGR